jgi:hypothetical protein
MVGRVQKDLYSIEEARAELTLADSYVSDHRMGSIITLSNVLFLLEQRNEGLSPEEIQTNRTRYRPSLKIEKPIFVPKYLKGA